MHEDLAQEIFLRQREAVTMPGIIPFHFGIPNHHVAAHFHIHHFQQHELVPDRSGILGSRWVESASALLHLLQHLAHFLIRYLDFFCLGFLELQFSLDHLRDRHVFGYFHLLGQFIALMLPRDAFLLRRDFAFEVRQHDQVRVHHGNDAVFKMSGCESRRQGQEHDEPHRSIAPEWQTWTA